MNPAGHFSLYEGVGEVIMKKYIKFIVAGIILFIFIGTFIFL